VLVFSLNTTKLGDKPKPVKASRELLSTNLPPIRYFAFACQTRNRLISAKGSSTKSLLTPRPFGISNSRSFAMIFEHFIVPRNNACAWPTVFNWKETEGKERREGRNFWRMRQNIRLPSSYCCSWRGTIVAVGAEMLGRKLSWSLISVWDWSTLLSHLF